MDGSNYDFKYTNQEFILAICGSLRMDMEQAQQYTDTIKSDVVDTQIAFKPYLLIDTDFKRTTQPIFALAACEGQRYIFFRRDFWLSPKAVKLLHARLKIKEFMRSKNGSAGIWGHAQRFSFYIHEDFAYVFDTHGHIIGEKVATAPSAALLNI